MAEIKSAVELALEKTKGLSLSGQEKEKIREEESQAKARSLVNRYLQVDFHLREMEKELARHAPEEREHLAKLVYQYLCEAIRVDGENDLVFGAIETFREGKKEIPRKGLGERNGSGRILRAFSRFPGAGAGDAENFWGGTANPGGASQRRPVVRGYSREADLRSRFLG